MTLTENTDRTRILIVEDEWIIANDIKMSLKDMGYDVVGVVSIGRVAIEKADELRPDIILMDIMLEGEMDGIETASIVHERLDIPVIFLTAYSDNRFLERSKMTEPFGYLLKPFKAREIQIVIEIALYKHKMEKRLREGKRWLDAVFDSIYDGAITTDKDGRVTFINRVASILTGYSLDEVLGMPVEEVFKLRLEPNISYPFKAIDNPDKKIPPAEYALLQEDDAEVYVEAAAAPIMDDRGQSIGSIITFRDVTQKRQLADRIKAVEQLSGLGRMAAGVAHELNNPLTGVLTFARMLQGRLPSENKEDRRDLSLIIDQAERCSRIVSGLLGFSSTISSNKSPQDINKVIMSVLKTMYHDDRIASETRRLDNRRFSSISIQTMLDRSLPEVVVDRTQLEEVLVNLLHNAADAINGIGDIFIRTGLYEENGVRYVEIQIEDTGHGIEPEHKERLFEPFFTTRPVGYGTGLGLSVAHGIIRMYGGVITFESEPDSGATFFVRLPVDNPSK